MRIDTLTDKPVDQTLFYGVLLTTLILAIITTSAYGAGTSSQPAPQNSSTVDKRQKANLYFAKGKDFQAREQWQQAAEQYEISVRSDPDYAEAWSNLGYCYRKQEQFQRAVAIYKRALRLDPNLAEAHEYLGETYAVMGKFELAERELLFLRNLGSDEADELEAFIEEMKRRS